MIKWSSTTRLDEYTTLKALRRQIALADYSYPLDRKPRHRRHLELALALSKEVADLNETLKVFGLFSESSKDLRKRVEIMRRIREDLGSVLLYSFRVANALDVDIARSIQEKIYPALEGMDQPWKK